MLGIDHFTGSFIKATNNIERRHSPYLYLLNDNFICHKEIENLVGFIFKI